MYSIREHAKCNPDLTYVLVSNSFCSNLAIILYNNSSCTCSLRFTNAKFPPPVAVFNLGCPTEQYLDTCVQPTAARIAHHRARGVPLHPKSSWHGRETDGIAGAGFCVCDRLAARKPKHVKN